MDMVKVFKSIGACLAGIIVGIILSVGTDKILESTGVFPSPELGLFIWWMLLLALVYRGIYLVIAGYVTARLAPGNSLVLVTIIGILGVIVTILGAIANWDKTTAWYPIALAVITFPCTYLGGKLFVNR